VKPTDKDGFIPSRPPLYHNNQERKNMESTFVRSSSRCVVSTTKLVKAIAQLQATRQVSENRNEAESSLFANVFARTRQLTCCLMLCFSVLIFAGASQAKAQDDNENSTPTAWWMNNGQSMSDISNTIHNDNARIIDISVENPSAFTVTYVQNTGSYAKAWWWYVGVDAPTLTQNLTNNNARLISLKAYDIGGGNIRFAAVMISNTGADQKGWWWYYGQTPAAIGSLTAANNARPTAIQSYSSNGQTLYSCIMISNTGSDNKGWWWYYNVSPQSIGDSITANSARLLDVTSAGNGNFNVTMESCSNNCPGWWWYYGLDAYSVLAEAQNYGARPITTDTYSGNCNGSNKCFATVMISNVPDDVTACDPLGCISEAKFMANINNSLANNTVGYSALVGNMRPNFAGLARTDTDPPSLAMAPNLVMQLASVSKNLTTIAILQLLAQDGLTVDTKISPYIYSDWTQGPNIDLLTFRELLTHESGFTQKNQNNPTPPGTCGSENDYGSLETLVSNGVNASDIGNTDYGNCNFSLLRELMPALQGQTLTNYPDGSQRAAQSSQMYIDYMNANVFQPVGVPVSACDVPSGTNYILDYPYPAGTESGYGWGGFGLQCGAFGWLLSPDQVFDVMDSLANDNTLLTNTEKYPMFAGSLGWDNVPLNNCTPGSVCKSGFFTTTVGSNTVPSDLWTYAGIFKCNVPVVVFVNSAIGNLNDIRSVVNNAFNNSSVQGAPVACPGYIVPKTTLSVSGNSSGSGGYVGSAMATLSASESGGLGVGKTFYSVDNAACLSSSTTSCQVYSGPFAITDPGTHTVRYFSVDKEGYSELVNTQTVTIVPSFACHVAYTINSQWTNGGGQPDGFNANISITNTGINSINNWDLTWSFANGQTFGQYPSNGNFSQNGASVSVTNMSYNGTIAPGGTISGIGFNGTWNGTANAAPASFAVNGITCQ
jgi:CubicO group peptidase (beta-lactamase class C family)